MAELLGEQVSQALDCVREAVRSIVHILDNQSRGVTRIES